MMNGKMTEYIILFFTLVALGLSIAAIVKPCKSHFADAGDISNCIPAWGKGGGNISPGSKARYFPETCSAHGIGTSKLTMHSLVDCMDWLHSNKCKGSYICNNGNGVWESWADSNVYCRAL